MTAAGSQDKPKCLTWQHTRTDVTLKLCVYTFSVQHLRCNYVYIHPQHTASEVQSGGTICLLEIVPTWRREGQKPGDQWFWRDSQSCGEGIGLVLVTLTGPSCTDVFYTCGCRYLMPSSIMEIASASLYLWQL